MRTEEREERAAVDQHRTTKELQTTDIAVLEAKNNSTSVDTSLNPGRKPLNFVRLSQTKLHFASHTATDIKNRWIAVFSLHISMKLQ